VERSIALKIERFIEIVSSAKMKKMPPDHSPRRIVSLQPSATVILENLGQTERLVACTRYCTDLYPELKDGKRAIISDSWTAKADEILAAKPDLVLASVPYQEKSFAEILKAGVPLLALSPRSLADIYKDIAMIAGIVGEGERGEELIADMQHEITETRNKTRSLNRPRVFCEEWGKPLIASQQWVAELVEIAGGEFIGTPGVKTSVEEVLAAKPDVVIAAWCGAGDRVPIEKIVRDRGWEQTHFAQHGRVYCINDEFLNTPAPTLLQGLRALAAAIHPEVFPSSTGLRQMQKEPSHKPKLQIANI
jgi:iron complex transport system substrate-binding protein